MRLESLSEKSLIAAIKKDFPTLDPDLLLGIGDDAAVLKHGSKSRVITKDLLIEDFHFFMDSHPPGLLGRKSLNVNLSDVAAMGCKPRYALLGLGIPVETPPDWIQRFFSGLKEASDEYRVILIGGDLTQSQKVVISLTVIGEGERVIERSGAQEGDLVYVSGTLGDSGQGLVLVKTGVKLGQGKDSDFLLHAFLDPIPQVTLGKELASFQLASSMIDISDGLSVDLSHLCEESGKGAEVFLDRLPLSRELVSMAEDPLSMALHGGEDYQLLFTVPPEKENDVQGLSRKFRVTKIGRIVKGQSIVAVDKKGKRRPLEIKGYQHFKT